MSRAATFLSAFIPAKMPLRAYPDQHTSHEGQWRARIGTTRTESQPHQYEHSDYQHQKNDDTNIKKQETCQDAALKLDQTPHEYILMSPQNKDLPSNGSATIT